MCPLHLSLTVSMDVAEGRDNDNPAKFWAMLDAVLGVLEHPSSQKL